jgi:hypothetical protein
MSEDRDAYDAGHTAGAIDARLAGHDAHFAKINGSIERVADEMAGMKLLLQRLADSADADRKTVVVTAAALKDAEEARRSTTNDRWSPWQKAIALITGAGALAALAALILTHGGKP